MLIKWHRSLKAYAKHLGYSERLWINIGIRNTLDKIHQDVMINQVSSW